MSESSDLIDALGRQFTFPHNVKGSQWISVKDKMPNCSKFLAYYHGDVEVLNNKCYILTTDGQLLHKNEFIIGQADWGGRRFYFTHWMPLPPPPEAEK